ncbi:fumarylacetoacetate hydrolase family protein [Pseudonocardia sp. WMMC193]|uniref:fumarylacetoacetate hydrolase family protein n=1 Tax=Pseudonocardia sp. WMMC193 TaxID=2911965 RepID=UPI001F3D76E9|nr:fumarylacetoacetate hydrolase family protein [Pseudonocardia sp. WMMC193]MCF7547926.1 fumarylacetoacetate hydrolase family protein [Pseudonocardia sp. WMMC193]
MRLVSYMSEGSDEPRFGRIVTDGATEGVVDGCGATGGRFRSVREVLAAGALRELAAATEGRAADLPVASVTLLPPVPDPAKIICVGVNYRSHLDETRRPDNAHPTLFSRFPDTQIGHDQPAVRPAETSRFDYEGELAVVIGARADHVPEAEAAQVVAGYSCYDDLSVRDWQRHTSQFLPGKNFRATGGFGPWLVTADEVDDISAATLRTRVNGELRQEASISQLIFGIPELIAYITTFTVLAPGDVIVTGTPGGVGLFRDPPVFLADGDLVEVEITGIGRLVNPVVAA